MEPRRRVTIGGIASGLAVALVAFALCFGVGEAVTRFLFGRAIVLFPRHHAEARYGDFALRRLEPNARFWHTSADGSWEFRTNAQGFRDDEDWSLEKPPGQLRVLVLGDSQTQGFEARQEHTFAAVMQRALRRRGLDAKVMNAGVSGFSTAEELVYLENEGIRYAPDAVVLGFFGNDFEDNVKAGLFALRDGELVQAKISHLPGVRALRFVNAVPGLAWLSENSYLYSLAMNTVWEAAKARLLARSRAQLATEYAVEDAGARGDGETRLALALLARMHAFCRSRGIPLIVLDVPHPDVLQLDPSSPPDAAFGFHSSVPDALVAEFEAASDAYLPSQTVLARWTGIAEIHVPHGHRHIGELSHLALGVAAADAVATLLADAPAEASQPPAP